MLSLQVSPRRWRLLVLDGRVNSLAVLLMLVIGVAPHASAAPPVFEVDIRDHLFYPDRLVIPSGVKVKLIVNNNDPTPEEFESYELNREKVIMGGRKATLFIGPLKPGEYPFFGEFNPQTAQGKIIAQ